MEQTLASPKARIGGPRGSDDPRSMLEEQKRAVADPKALIADTKAMSYEEQIQLYARRNRCTDQDVEFMLALVRHMTSRPKAVVILGVEGYREGPGLQGASIRVAAVELPEQARFSKVQTIQLSDKPSGQAIQTAIEHLLKG